MTKKKEKTSNKRQKYVKKTDITSRSPNHEIRSYFIDTTIELIEYLREREHNKQIRDKEKEKIRVNRVKAIINACNVGNRVLKDRQLLAENGMIVIVLVLDQYTGQVAAGPDIISRGFVYVKESDELMEEARSVVELAVEHCMDRNIHDWNKIKNVMRDELSSFIWKRYKRRPMILPIIEEV